MFGKNKLESGSLPEQLKNFVWNLLWAVVWLGRWIFRILTRRVRR